MNHAPAPDPTVRLVPSRFPPIGLLDTVATAADLAAVMDLEGWTNDRLVRDRVARLPTDEWVFGRPNASVVMAAFLHAALDVLVMVLALCALLSVVALVTRFHRARGVERQQLKWLAYAAAIVGGAFVLGIVMSLGIPEDKPEPGWIAVFDQLSFLSFSLLPIAIGVGTSAASRRPLGVAVVGGLAFSQVVTLYVTPVFYSYFDELQTWPGRRAKRAVTGEHPIPQPVAGD